MKAPVTEDIFEIVPWSRGFEVGIPIIDEQHQQLVKLLNMMDLMSSSTSTWVPTLTLLR